MICQIIKSADFKGAIVRLFADKHGNTDIDIDHVSNYPNQINTKTFQGYRYSTNISWSVNKSDKTAKKALWTFSKCKRFPRFCYTARAIENNKLTAVSTLVIF